MKNAEEEKVIAEIQNLKIEEKQSEENKHNCENKSGNIIAQL